MPRVVHRHQVDAGDLDAWRRPRHEVVHEVVAEAPDQAAGEAASDPAEDGEGAEVLRFALDEGPFHRWERWVVLAPAHGTGPATVTETVDYDLAVPVWGPLFSFALRRRLRRGIPPSAGAPWWAPSVVLDARAATVLGTLCVIGAVAGYLGTLITQTVTFAAREFGASTTDQGTLLASVRIGVLLSLLVVATADRRGRAVVLRGAIVAGCLVTALGALAPGMVWLGTSQTFARALSTVAALVIAIIAAEEMPAGARAFAVSVLAMTAALGAGLCVINVAYADVAEGAWRAAYLLPLLAALPVWRMARRIPETRRFERHQLAPTSLVGAGDAAVVVDRPATGGDARARRFDLDWGRFALLSASGFLWSLFLAPAAQFLNEFLRAERGFSGLQITIFVLATNTPGGLGIVLGGQLADRHGRRLIGIIGIAAGVGFTVMSYLTWGWPLWASSILAAVIGSIAVPAMGVYGPELFPTAQRGVANGGLQVLSVAGSSVGLLVAGWLGDRLDGLGPAMAVLSVGPLLLIVLIACFYPETAHRELEDLNPTDRRP